MPRGEKQEVRVLTASFKPGYNRSSTEPIRLVIFYVSDPDTPFLDPIKHWNFTTEVTAAVPIGMRLLPDNFITRCF